MTYHLHVAKRETVRAEERSEGRHRPGVDLLRLVSVIALVWFHLDAPGKTFFYAGLPAALVISVALTVTHDRKRSLLAEVKRRGDRLILPWIFWSAFYWALLAVRSAYHGTLLGVVHWWECFLIGPQIHLWYLPFAFLAVLVALAMQRSLARWPVAYVCGVGAVLGGIFLIVAPMLAHQARLGPPFGQWAFGLAAIPFGLAVGVACRARSSLVPMLFLGISITCTLFCLLLVLLGDRSTAIAYGIGVPLVCLAFLWPYPLNALGKTLAPLSLGIYVLHPFIFEQLYRFGLSVTGANAAAVISLATLLVSWVLRFTPIRRFL